MFTMHFNVPLWIKYLKVQVAAAFCCSNISMSILATEDLLGHGALSKDKH